MLDQECSESIGTKEDPSEQTTFPDSTNLIKTTTKPRTTTNGIIVGDYEGRYNQDLAIVYAKTNVTSVNETLEYAAMHRYYFIHLCMSIVIISKQYITIAYQYS